MNPFRLFREHRRRLDLIKRSERWIRLHAYKAPDSDLGHPARHCVECGWERPTHKDTCNTGMLLSALRSTTND